MDSSITNFIFTKQGKINIPDFKSGDFISVHEKIKLKNNKHRIQQFIGLCISYKNKRNLNASIIVRRITKNIKVEKTFKVHSPLIESITVKKKEVL